MVGAVSLNTNVSSYQYSGGYGRNMRVQAGKAAAGNVRVRAGQSVSGGEQVQAAAGNTRVRAAQSVSGGERVRAAQSVSGSERVHAAQALAGSGQVQAGQKTGAVSGSHSVSTRRAGGVSSLIGARSIAAAGQASGVAAVSAGRAADPESPVQPVDKISTVQPGNSGSTNYMIPFLRKGMDPAELSVRMRMQNAGAFGRTAAGSGFQGAGKEAVQMDMPGTSQGAGKEAVQIDLPGSSQGTGKEAVQLDLPGSSQGAGKEAVQLDLPGTGSKEAVQAELPGTSTEEAAVQAGLPGTAAQTDTTPAAGSQEDAPKVAGMGAENAQKTSEEAECKTCQERKYQDGSNDPGVSFKTPTHIGPDQSTSAVRGHEMEHVVRERAKAQSEGRRVISQSVSMQTGICPECGSVYVAGGVTRTTTAADTKQQEKPKDPRWILASDI